MKKMRIRNGFVSNSSSSSFVVLGEDLNKEESMGAPWGGPYRKSGRELNENDREPTVDDLIDKLETLNWIREYDRAIHRQFKIYSDGWLWFDGKRIETDNIQAKRLKAIFQSTRNELLMEAYKAACK